MKHQNKAFVDFDKICEMNSNEIAFASVMSIYHSVIEMTEARAKVLSSFKEERGERNPIDTVKSRVKSVSGIRDKLDEKKLDYTIENVLKIGDIAGVRIICPFIDDVYEVERFFMSQEDMELIAKKDYIANPKDNGYRSLHLIMEVNMFFPDGISRAIPVEIQIRTIAMELWGNIEHKLRYKKTLTPDVDRKIAENLIFYSQLMNEIDTSFLEMREMVVNSEAE